MKVLVHDGIGIWLCARRLNQGRFLWANAGLGSQLVMTREQLDALLQSSEKLDAAQASLLEETLDADLAAIEEELKQLRPPPTTEDKQQPRRTPLPADLPRVEVRHEPESTTCTCGCALKRIGEDVAEKLDYVPGVFTVERHVRGKWACAKCQTLIQAPVPAQVIDKGIPTAGLLAQVMVAKYADHLPLYRQETIFGRAGLAIPRSARGSAPVAYACSHWSTRSRKRSSITTFCMPTKRPWRCSSLAPARRTALTCGPTPQAPSKA